MFAEDGKGRSEQMEVGGEGKEGIEGGWRDCRED